MKKFMVSGIILLMLLIVSCETDKKSVLKSSSGKEGEIVVVLEKNHWEGFAGKQIQRIMGPPIYGLPQYEPLFDVKNITPSLFNDLFKAHRNIIHIDIEKDLEKNKIEVKRNVWAKPQIVIRIHAKSDSALVNIFKENQQQFTQYFLENELIRIQRAFLTKEKPELIEEIKNDFGISLILQKGFFIAKKKSDFAWIRRETEETSIGILIYTEPYKDTTQFSNNYIVALRDKISKAHIEGPYEGSYMTTEKEFEPPLSVVFEFKGHYAIETKGLWKTGGKGFMGGPFLNFTILDQGKNRVITIDGFVYAPKFNKRTYIRQIRAMLSSLEFAK